jgi:hypothetical protein
VARRYPKKKYLKKNEKKEVALTREVRHAAKTPSLPDAYYEPLDTPGSNAGKCPGDRKNPYSVYS